MLKAEILDAALGCQRQMYRYLTELSELTAELGKAAERQDPVSIRMFLKLRQEPLSRVAELRRGFRMQCRGLPEEERAHLLALLNNPAGHVSEEEAPLAKQSLQNQNLLERLIAADRQVSLQINRNKSFYRRKR